MRTFGSATALVMIAALAVGCGGVVDGTATPAPNLKPRPLTGASVRQVPLDDVTLSRMLGQPFVGRIPPEFGGPEKLYSQIPPASCLGVTAMLQKSVYEPAEVKDVASESWWNNGDPAQVISVMQGVVTLPTAAQAEMVFAKFSRQWQQCNGATSTEQNGPISTTISVSDIRVTNSVVAATNTATSVLPNMPALQPTPQARAIGVRLNCLVEVEVVFFGDRRPSDPGSANLDTSAVDIAHAMMDTVSGLS
ncbi:sensor domain-containing protein [Mycobacterium sp.]|jgi:PknH-like extracellular domain|uniref:sensor domain-containing protein n=1 Tax=Mycobacterium sp. TaxID=1785 RepID=UPI002D10BB36|nr:sensor domain-containing protein [Mycobacterium sp.]HXB89754.1 sensor domain-containing protein [Mycobacterium sp.]